MKRLSITLCDGFWPRFHGNIMRAVMTLLEGGGHQVTPVPDGLLDLVACDVVWMLGTVNRFPVLRRQLAAMPEPQRPLVILWHTELLPPPRAAGLPWPRLAWWEVVRILRRDPRATDVYTNFFRLRQFARRRLPDVLVAPTRDRYEFLVERNLQAYWVPIGYDPALGNDLGLVRDIDVLFLGSPHVPRRERVIKGLQRRGVNLTVMGSPTDPACWGENRTRLVNRTKILLNLSRSSGQFPDLRFILGMANKSLVISEPIHHPAPYVAGQHFISATFEEMPEVIAYYLAHESERERVANEGHRFVTREVTMIHSVNRILELVRESHELL